MKCVLKNGQGWRIGWNPDAEIYQGLVGADDWAIELTATELDDFCRLLAQLAETMHSMTTELMNEEKISCEAESDLVWLEVEGYPHAYSLRLIVHQGRSCEGNWSEDAVATLVEAAQTLKIL